MKLALLAWIAISTMSCYGSQQAEDWALPILERTRTFLKCKAACEKAKVGFIWVVEFRTNNSVDFYLGEDMGDHTNRIKTIRIMRDGTVKIHEYDDEGEDIWIPEK